MHLRGYLGGRLVRGRRGEDSGSPGQPGMSWIVAVHHADGWMSSYPHPRRTEAACVGAITGVMTVTVLVNEAIAARPTGELRGKGAVHKHRPVGLPRIVGADAVASVRTDDTQGSGRGDGDLRLVRHDGLAHWRRRHELVVGVLELLGDRQSRLPMVGVGAYRLWLIRHVVPRAGTVWLPSPDKVGVAVGVDGGPDRCAGLPLDIDRLRGLLLYLGLPMHCELGSLGLDIATDEPILPGVAVTVGIHGQRGGGALSRRRVTVDRGWR